MSTLFKTLAELLEKVAATRSRLRMIDQAAAFLKTLEPAEVEPAISLMVGRPFPKWSQETLNINWAILSSILQRVTGSNWNAFSQAFSGTGDIGSATMAVYEKSKMRRQAVLFEKPLTILEVRRSLEAVADAEGTGSREKKEHIITALLSQASSVEAKYLVKVFTGEMRTGFSEGLMEQTVAKAFDVSLLDVQRGTMALGDIGEVALIAKAEGAAGLQTVGFRVFRPVTLMLAQVADDIAAALEEHGGETAFEYKYDGARVQIHKLHGEVRVFSRRLTDATLSLPEIVDAVKTNVKADEAILEGEVVAVNQSGVPIPFQHLM
jgi:DNA ligase 1